MKSLFIFLLGLSVGITLGAIALIATGIAVGVTLFLLNVVFYATWPIMAGLIAIGIMTTPFIWIASGLILAVKAFFDHLDSSVTDTHRPLSEGSDSSSSSDEEGSFASPKKPSFLKKMTKRVTPNVVTSKGPFDRIPQAWNDRGPTKQEPELDTTKKDEKNLHS